MKKKGSLQYWGSFHLGVICHFHEYGRYGKPNSVWIISPICKGHSLPTSPRTASRVMTSVGAESFGISWWFGNLCGAKQHVEAYFQILKSWNIYTSLFDLNQISYFVIIELLCFFMCLTEKMNFLNNHIYTWHLVPIAVFDVLFALDLHKGLSLFLWSSSFIPQNALPVMVGPNVSIYSLPCFGWVSPHLHQWKCSSISATEN